MAERIESKIRRKLSNFEPAEWFRKKIHFYQSPFLTMIVRNYEKQSKDEGLTNPIKSTMHK
jgi:hypothetical protein